MSFERRPGSPNYQSAARMEEPVLACGQEVRLRAPDVLCVCERSRSFTLADPRERPTINSPEAAAELLVSLLGGLDREHCALLALDAKHRLIAISTVSIGSVEHTFMAPREVFRDAIVHGASAVIIGHNHPSADARPSAEDRAVSRRLAQAGTTLGIPLLDHLVIGHPEWTSLAREGVL